MKFRSYAILIGAIVVAGALAFVLQGQAAQTAAMMAAVFTVLTAFSAFLAWAPGAAFVEQKSRWVVGVGFGIAALAVAIFVWTVGGSPSTEASEPYITASVAVAMTAFLLISAPKIARQSSAARRLQRSLPPVDGAPRRLSYGLRDGVAALVRLAEEAKSFLKTCWLWLLISTVPLLLAGAAWGAGYVEPAIQVAGIGIGWLGFIIGLPTVLVTWHRLLIEGRRPGWVTLPDRAAFSYGWRLWIYTSIASRAANWASEAAGHWALHQGSIQAYAPAVVVNALVFAVICALFSFQALRLAAVAVGDAALSLPAAVAAARRMRLSLPLGVLVAMTPFFAFRALAGILILATGQTVATMVITFAMEFAVQFFAFGAAAALISSAYTKVVADRSATQALQ